MAQWSPGNWYYNNLRPYLTFLRALAGFHTDFRPIGDAVVSPSGELFVVLMANVNYRNRYRGRMVTFDVRNARDEFVHHIQTETPALGTWVVAWHNDTTVIVKSHEAAPEAFGVGQSGLAYGLSRPFASDVSKSIETLQLPLRRVSPTLARHKSKFTRR
jgi:hypothetical protein